MNAHRKEAIERMIGLQRSLLRTQGGFTCACCLKRNPSEEAADVRLYEPRDAMMSIAVPKDIIATYVICKACDSLPEMESHPRIEQYLISQGLMGGKNS